MAITKKGVTEQLMEAKSDKQVDDLLKKLESYQNCSTRTLSRARRKAKIRKQQLRRKG